MVTHHSTSCRSGQESNWRPENPEMHCCSFVSAEPDTYDCEVQSCSNTSRRRRLFVWVCASWRHRGRPECLSTSRRVAHSRRISSWQVSLHCIHTFHWSRGVHGNGNLMGIPIPVGFPWFPRFRLKLNAWLHMRVMNFRIIIIMVALCNRADHYIFAL